MNARAGDPKGYTMSEQEPEDVGASTEKFQAFMRDGGREPQPASGNTFRVLTLVAGLVVLALLIWLLLR